MTCCRGRWFALLAVAVSMALISLSTTLESTAPGAPFAQAAQTPIPTKLAGRTCVPVAAAVQQPNKDICLRAHVYAVVELADGTRFLDVCPAEMTDDECRFTLLSLPEDRDDVGDLRKYRDMDVTVRGVVHATHGRMGIQISHIRQFSGGPEKFRPNPKLLRDFNGQSDRMPVRDPNLAASGRHRSFMNSRDKETLPPEPLH